MAQTTDVHQTERFLQEYLQQLQAKFVQYSIQLSTQALSCPKSMDLSFIENSLKEFVRLHHLDLTRKVYYQTNQFKSFIHEKELFQLLSLYPFTNEQVSIF